MIARWLGRRESLFFAVTGFAEGMLTALVLAAGGIADPAGARGAGTALKLGVVAGLPEIVVLFSAEYARQRRDILRIEQQLSFMKRGHLVAGSLGRMALIEALAAAVLSGACAFAGACVPLLLAGVVPGNATLAIALGCLAALGAGVGRVTESCIPCWAAALAIAGSAMAWIGIRLHVV